MWDAVAPRYPIFDDLHGDEPAEPALVDLGTELCDQVHYTYRFLSDANYKDLPFIGFLFAGRHLCSLHLQHSSPARLEWILPQLDSPGEVKFILRSSPAAGVALGVNYSWEIEVSKRNIPDLEYLFDSCFEALSRIKGTDSYFELPSLQDAPGLSTVFFLAVMQKGFQQLYLLSQHQLLQVQFLCCQQQSM
eukprot:m51a1_g11540 hypothetical protein (191) ;mRNA; f:4838-7188